MWRSLLVAYALGVVSCIPLILLAALGWLWLTSESVAPDSQAQVAEHTKSDKDGSETASTTGVEGKQLYHVTARKTFDPAPEPPTTTTTTLTSSLRSFLSSPGSTSATTGSPAAKQQAQRVKDKYTLVIKQRTVYLYYGTQRAVRCSTSSISPLAVGRRAYVLPVTGIQTISWKANYLPRGTQSDFLAPKRRKRRKTTIISSSPRLCKWSPSTTPSSISLHPHYLLPYSAYSIPPISHHSSQH